jgi:sphingomyelin phosphodiesterase acid-like 3
MRSVMLRSVLAFALAVSLLLVLAHPQARAASTPDAPQTWLILSDIHFDPFTQPRLVDRLAAASPDRWRAIFATGEATAPSGAGSDTNDALLESTLDGAHQAVPDPRVVIVAGDFLAHEFREKFNRTAKVHDDAAYAAFVDKTMAFLAWELQTAFPRARLLPVIGNNDGYCGDYQSTPHDPFLAHMGADFALSVGAHDPNAFIAQFSTGGYYTVPLPVDNAQAIVLNNVFWSTNYKNACGDPKADPGGDELAWLQATQKAMPLGTPVWIIAHIPPGVDVFATQRAKSPGTPVMFLTDRFNGEFLTALDSRFTVVMSITGHTHQNSFRIIGPDPSMPRAPMLVVPSVSPIYSNAPAFTVANVDSNYAWVLDTQIYMLSKIKDVWTWHREYDFGSIYGHGTIDAAHLASVQRAIFDDERVRRRFEEYYQTGDGVVAQITESNWRAYWCGNVALTATDFVACAMPQIQQDLEPHPTPPPTPTPSPSPKPTASPSPTPTPSPAPSPSP